MLSRLRWSLRSPRKGESEALWTSWLNCHLLHPRLHPLLWKVRAPSVSTSSSKSVILLSAYGFRSLDLIERTWFFFFSLSPLFETDVSPRAVTSPGRLVWDAFHSYFIDFCFVRVEGKIATLTALSVKVTLQMISQSCFLRIFCRLNKKHCCPLLFHSFSKASTVVFTWTASLSFFSPCLLYCLSFLNSSFLIFILLVLCLYFSTSTPHIYPPFICCP